MAHQTSSTTERPWIIPWVVLISLTEGWQDCWPTTPHAQESSPVSEPEALLYYDDLTLQIGRVPGLPGAFRIVASLLTASLNRRPLGTPPYHFAYVESGMPCN